jgi:glutamine synthetase
LKPDNDLLNEVTAVIGKLQSGIAALEKILEGNHAKTTLAEARYACDKILPAMLEVRTHADALEGLVADDLWPLPTYQEMLFIR